MWIPGACPSAAASEPSGGVCTHSYAHALTPTLTLTHTHTPAHPVQLGRQHLLLSGPWGQVSLPLSFLPLRLEVGTLGQQLHGAKQFEHTDENRG